MPPPSQAQSLLDRKNVSLHWVDLTGGLVRFTVWEPSGAIPDHCRWIGVSNGTCWFLSVAGVYEFSAVNYGGTVESQNVTYVGTYQAPMP
ncbi:MAG: hypothetical protein L3K10_00300 [Thermoplasmata archaeon]|nr:hypothetical protein [Thermoplasmata archaeon]